MNVKIFFFLIIFINCLFANTNTKVQLQLSWFNQFQFAGYYIAKEKGFYEDVSLQVEIKNFDFGIDVPKEVDENRAEFGVGRETLILDKAKGRDIVALYALFQSSPLVLLSTKESNINSIKDFENKKIMTTIDDASEVSIKSMILSQKLDIKNLNFIKHTHNINDLVEKNTDVISAYTSKSPFTLQKMRVKYNMFAPKDYGFDMYSDFLFTSEKMIQNNLDTVKKFKQASLRGWEYAYTHIEEAVELILEKYNNQNLTKEELIFEANELKKLSYLSNHTLGDIQLSKVQRIHDLYNVMGVLPKKVNISEFVFSENEFFNYLSEKEKQFIIETNYIIVGTESDKKPFSYTEETGLHNGILHDILELISQTSGIKFLSKSDHQENLITSFKDGKLDVLALASDVVVGDSFFTTTYFKLNERFFKRSDFDDSFVHTVGTLHYSNDRKKVKDIKAIYPTAVTIKFESIENAVEALLSQNIDLLYMPEELVLAYIKDNYITNIDYVSNSFTNEIRLQMRTNKESQLLNAVLSKAIKHISKEQKKAIQNKWVPLMFEKRIDWTQIILVTLLAIALGIYIVYKNILLRKVTSKLELANKELQELSQKDHLTKLYNRRYFENIAHESLALARREKQPLSLLMFDIDDFKDINDTFGHKIGDYTLIALSKTLLENRRESDIVARIGGEEFVILLQNTPLQGAKLYSEKLREAIEKMLIEKDGIKVKITVSMGLAEFGGLEELQSVMLRVDKSLYQAKRAGKNQLKVSEI